MNNMKDWVSASLSLHQFPIQLECSRNIHWIVRGRERVLGMIGKALDKGKCPAFLNFYLQHGRYGIERLLLV